MKLSANEANAVEQIVDSVYTCGCVLFPPDHPLQFTVFVRVGITCESLMEVCNYGATNVHFLDVCYYCGESEPDQLLDNQYIKELKKQFAIVRPLCIDSCSAGK